MSHLVAESLTFSYRSDRVVFRDVSLETRAGEVLVLLGGNGAGKTTLLRTLAGQLTPSSGKVVLDDRLIQHWPRREVAKRLALMPQFERRDAPMTVRDMVQLGRAAHRGWWAPLDKDDDQRVEKALVVTDTIELADRCITQLSGGEFQRAALARSIAQDAQVLLLDEPTSGLDLKHQQTCLSQVVRWVKDNQLTAIISLHDLHQAAVFADRIALMSHGQLQCVGTCEQVLVPEQIQRAYGIDVDMVPHPRNGRPLLIPKEPGDHFAAPNPPRDA